MPTTHREPTYLEEGVLHYCVANMPGAVPLTSTAALTNATLPYAAALAGRGWQEVARENAGVRDGINIALGKVTYRAVADAFALPYTPVDELLINGQLTMDN